MLSSSARESLPGSAPAGARSVGRDVSYGALASAPATPNIIAVSAVMASVLAQVARFARSPDPVAIVGETGSGKSTLARLLHQLSGRLGRLVEMSGGELNSDLAQDDLFGHGSGAFTGAVGKREGLFAAAEGGTVLIDDFHDVPLPTQRVLLRLLDRGEYRRLGNDRPVPFRGRMVVGGHERLDEMMRRGRLVADLRYRLGMHEIWVPGLADRPEDIGPLSLQFLAERLAESHGAGPVRIDAAALALFELYSWPGNVRELRAVVRRAFTEALEREAISLEDIVLNVPVGPLFDRCASAEAKRRLVQWALRSSGHRVKEAARLIGAHRNTVAAIRARLRKEGGEAEVLYPDRVGNRRRAPGGRRAAR